MKIDKKSAAVVIMAMSLGACQQNVFKGMFGPRADVSATTMKRSQADGMIALEEGRDYLRRGQISAAVASFKIARLDPQLAAEAQNGIGVAYARLGRLDVADKYFRSALRLDPANDRFAGNLLRLQRQVLMARSVPETVEQTELAARVEPRKQSFEETFAAMRATRKPVVRITTATELAPAPTMVVANIAPVEDPQGEEATDGEEKKERVTLLSRANSGPLEIAF